MRRSGHDMAERRILLQSTSKNNSLARIYRKVNLEQKSFISTSQFDKRLLLNKQEKFRQLRRSEQKTSMYQRNDCPRVPSSNPRPYPTSLTNPRGLVSRNSFETPARRKMDSQFGKKALEPQTKSSSLGVIHKISDPSVVPEEHCKRTQWISTEFKNRLEHQENKQASLSPSKAYMVEDCLESPTNQSSMVNIGDIFRYGGYDRRRLQNGGKTRVERNGETIHSAVTPLQQSNNSQNISPRKQNKIKPNPQVSITSEDNSTRSPNEDSDTEHEKISKSSNKKKDFDKPNRSPKTPNRPSLPSLGILRRGSMCDVKTFTSGRVLDDLLSTLELSSLEVSTSGKKSNYLNVEDLKYCRYLRSASTSSEYERDSSEDFPSKYRPSKNIIIGHTKILQ